MTDKILDWKDTPKKTGNPKCCQCGEEMELEADILDPERGKMRFYTCARCDPPQHQMIFEPSMSDQSKACCGKCKNYFKKGHFASHKEDDKPCMNFEEDREIKK